MLSNTFKSHRIIYGASILVIIPFLMPRALFSRAKQTSLVTSTLKASGKLAFEEDQIVKGNKIGSIYTIEPDGSNKTLLLKGTSTDSEVISYESPDYSPDGKRIVLMRVFVSADVFESQIYVLDGDGANLKRITDAHDMTFDNQPVFNVHPKWSPDGAKIVFTRGNYELRPNGNANAFDLVAHYAICTMNADGTNVMKLTDNDIGYLTPSWSPDGTRIVFSTRDAIGRGDIFIMSADGSNKINITKNGSTSFSPAWSPSGERIAFVSVRDSNPLGFNIFTVNSHGAELKRLTSSSSPNFANNINDVPVWSPDEKKIAFISTRDTPDGHFEIYTMNADGSEQKRLTYTTDGNIRWVTWQPIPLATPPVEIDTAQGFVAQQYHDFLNREPDASGFNFWTNEILSCGGDAVCTDTKRTNVSAAFFLSTEFQQTGFLVYRLYKAAFGRVPRFDEFLPDTQAIASGVIVGQTGWEQKLEQNKQKFINDFTSRAAFKQAFPDALTPAQYVDALNANTSNVLTPTERAALINGLTSGAETRSNILRKMAENQTFAAQEFNRAFVLMEYFGYLRRNPDDPPDGNLNGYNFWLNKLNQFNGDYIKSEMVRSFILSSEYRQRFAQ
jgi:Tol biopolymer transport system component